MNEDNQKFGRFGGNQDYRDVQSNQLSQSKSMPRIPAIEMSMDQLEKNVSALTESVGILLNRLATISNYKPSPEGNSAKTSCVCQFAGRVDGYADKIASLNLLLTEQIDSLEI